MATGDRHRDEHGTTDRINTETLVECGAVAGLTDEKQDAAREGIETFLAEYRERHPTGAIPDNPTTTAVVEGLATTIEQADPTTGPPIDVGERRIDRERDGTEVVVVATHDVAADEYRVLTDEQTVAEHTVAEYNPEYPREDRVVEAVYASSLPGWFDPEDREHDLHQLAEENEGIARLHGTDIDTYAFPESRLVPVEEADGQ